MKLKVFIPMLFIFVCITCVLIGIFWFTNKKRERNIIENENAIKVNKKTTEEKNHKKLSEKNRQEQNLANNPFFEEGNN